MGEGQCKVEQCLRPGLPYADGDDRRVIIEQGDGIGGHQQQRQSDKLCQQHGAGEAHPCPPLGPFILPCAQILPRKGGQRHGKGGDGQEHEALHLGVGAAARHGIGAEGIDVGLHHHVGDGDDGVLHTGGDALRRDLLEHRQLEADALGNQPIGAVRLHQLPEAQHGADHLAHHRGDGGAVDTPFQRSHEDQIQRHIGDGGDDEVAQGAAAVAHRLQNAHAGVVDDHKEAAHEVQSEILDGLGQHVLRRPHPHQDLGGQEDAHQRQQNAADHGEGQIGMHRRLQPIIALGAEIAADDNAGPHKQAHKKARHHKDEVPAAGHRRQSVLAHKFSYNDAVRRVIQLLTEIA